MRSPLLWSLRDPSFESGDCPCPLNFKQLLNEAIHIWELFTSSHSGLREHWWQRHCVLRLRVMSRECDPALSRVTCHDSRPSILGLTPLLTLSYSVSPQQTLHWKCNFEENIRSVQFHDPQMFCHCSWFQPSSGEGAECCQLPPFQSISVVPVLVNFCLCLFCRLS